MARVSYSNTFRLGTLRMRETLGTQHAPAQRTLATYHAAHPAFAVDQIKRSVPVSRTPLADRAVQRRPLRGDPDDAGLACSSRPPGSR
jgi:hypothetical protein